MFDWHPIILGLIVLLILAPVGLACLWGFMVLLNSQESVRFSDASRIIHQEPLAAALYFGIRFFAVAYLIGSLFSRFV